MNLSIEVREEIVKCIKEYLNNLPHEYSYSPFVDALKKIEKCDIRSNSFDSSFWDCFYNCEYSSLIFGNSKLLCKTLPEVCKNSTDPYFDSKSFINNLNYLHNKKNILNELNKNYKFKPLIDYIKKLPKEKIYEIVIDFQLNKDQFLPDFIKEFDNIDYEMVRYELMMKGFYLSYYFSDKRFVTKLDSFKLEKKDYLIYKLKDINFVCKVLQTSICIVNILDKKTLDNPKVHEVLLNAYKSYRNGFIGEYYAKFLPDFDISLDDARELVNISPKYYMYLPVQFRNNFEISNKVVESIPASGNSFLRSITRIVENDDVLIKLLNDKKITLNDVPLNFVKKRDIILDIIKKDPLKFKYITNIYNADEEMAEIVLSSNGEYLQYFNDSIKSSKHFIEIAVKQNPSAINFIPSYNDEYYDLLIFALKTNSESLKYLKKDHKKNPKVYAFLFSIDPNLVSDIEIDTFSKNEYINALENVKENDNELKESIILSIEKEFKGTTVISVLVNTYYKQYLTKINGDSSKDNKYDFLISVLSNYNVIQKIYSYKKFTMQDIRLIEAIVNNFPKDRYEYIRVLIKQAVESNQALNLQIYNDIVKANPDKDKLTTVFKKYNLTESNIYDFIINNRYYESIIKSSLMSIAKYYYGNGLRVIDIMNILSEMDERDLTIDQILSEKDIKKADWKQMVKDAEYNNPFLFDYINDSMSRNKSKGMKKVMRLGYKVLDSNIQSIEEYNSIFQMDHMELLNALKDTELYPKLMDKFSLFEDFNYNDSRGSGAPKK